MGLSHTSKTGAVYALLAAILFGASLPLAKKIIGDFHPIFLAGLFYLGGGIGLGIFWIATKLRGATTEAPLKKMDLPWLGIACLFGGIVAPILLMTGLNRTDAASSSLLLNLEGVFTILSAWFIFKENYNRKILLGVLFILSGGIILSWKGRQQGDHWLGDLFIVGSCLCWAIDNNFTRKISASDPVQTSGLKCLIAGIVNIGIGLSLGVATFKTNGFLQALIIGFFGYGLSLVLFVKALRLIGTARTSSYFSSAPFIGVVLSFLMYHEILSLTFGIAAALMGLGVWLHLTEHHEHEHVHDELDHEHLHIHDEHHQHEHSSNDPFCEPHSHRHHHNKTTHSHPHYPDTHHQHSH
jgi:drug/metabolite transporter (DMT)-like permease